MKNIRIPRQELLIKELSVEVCLELGRTINISIREGYPWSSVKEALSQRPDLLQVCRKE